MPNTPPQIPADDRPAADRFGEPEVEEAYGAADAKPQRRKLNPAQVALATVMAFLPEVVMILLTAIGESTGLLRHPDMHRFVDIVLAPIMLVVVAVGLVGGFMLFKRGDALARWAGLVSLVLHLLPAFFLLALIARQVVTFAR